MINFKTSQLLTQQRELVVSVKTVLCREKTLSKQNFN